MVVSTVTFGIFVVEASGVRRAMQEKLGRAERRKIAPKSIYFTRV